MNLLKNKTGIAVIVLIIAGSFVYAFNLDNGLFWDDDDWIINNNFVHSISWDNVKFWFSNNVLGGVGLKSNYYRPLLFFTFAFNWVLSETKPFLWHLVSNSIHVANAVLVFVLFRRYAGNLVSFLTALIFAIHPLNTEAVTYIAGRGDPLSVLFMLLGLLFFIKDIESPNTIRYKLFTASFLILAILSRETGIIFPFLLMIFYISFVAKDRFLSAVKKAFFEALPYFGVVLIYGILRLTVLNFQNTLNFYATPNTYSENLYVRVFTFLPILWEYLKLLVVPTGLHMERDAAVYSAFFQWPVWFVFLVLVGLLGWLWHLYKKNRVIPTTEFGVWFFGIFWFFVALAPVSGIAPINALMYEHWLYLPMVGFWLIVSYCLVKLLNFQGSALQGSTLNPQKGRTFIFGRTLLVVALVAYFSFFAYQSIQRNIIWKNPIEFYKNILKYEPESVRINNNLGNQYYNQKNIEQAEFYYRKAVELGDVFAQPHFNIGSILQSRGDIAGAIKEYEKAVKIDPDFFLPYQNLAVIYAQQGNLTKAAENIEKLKMLIPNNPRVYYNSALVYLALNNREKAIADLKEGLKYVLADPATGELIEELIGKLER